MSDNKKYYYIKVKDNYFEKDAIKILESQDNGYIYSLIILKLALKSAKHEGCLMMTDRIAYSPDKVDILAKIINHDVSHVRDAIRAAKELDIISIIGTEEIWMNDIQDMIGSSSTEADRKRKYRKKLKEREDIGQIGTNVHHYNGTNDRTNVPYESEMGQTSTRVKSIEYREQSLEIKNKEKKIKKENTSPFEKYIPPSEPTNPKPAQIIDQSIIHWNTKQGLPKTRKLLVNLGEKASVMVASVSLYSLDEILKSIDNYHAIQSSQDKYKPIATYGDVFGFLSNGIEKYWDESNPLRIMKIDKSTEQHVSDHIEVKQDEYCDCGALKVNGLCPECEIVSGEDAKAAFANMSFVKSEEGTK